MGTTMGKPLADCATSTLSCAAGEPQEMCSYGGGAPGHRPGQPCDWGDLSSLCTSQLASCECSAPTGIEASPLARYTEASSLDAAVVYAGPVMLWTLTLLVWPLYTHLTGWSRTFRPPRAVTSAVSRRAIVVWVALCVGATAALVLAALLLPAAAWGPCSQRGVCVYHMMFCEATRHHSAVRHPANVWLSVMMSNDGGHPRRRSSDTTSGSKASMLRADPIASRSVLDVPRSSSRNTSRATKR